MVGPALVHRRRRLPVVHPEEQEGRITIILGRVVEDRWRMRLLIDPCLLRLIREVRYWLFYRRRWYSSSVFSPLRIHSTVRPSHPHSDDC